MKKFLALLSLMILMLTGCSTAGETSSGITATNAFIKATDGEMMTGAFMTITNSTSDDVLLVGASSSAAQLVEIHQVVDGVMSKLEDGLSISAGDSAELSPGGNHIMLIGLASDIISGTEVPITLEFSDGSKIDVAAIAKDLNVGDEEYDSSANM